MLTLQRILAEAAESEANAPDLSHIHDGHRLLFFASAMHWISYSLLIATVLAKRGCKIDFVWCPVYEHDNQDPLNVFSWLAKEGLPILGTGGHGNIRFLRMEDQPLTDLPVGRDGDEFRRIIEQQSIEDTVNLAREVQYDLGGRHKSLYRRRKHLNQVALGTMRTIFAENEYDSVLIPNGKVFECGIAFQLARHLNIPTCTIESIFGLVDEQLLVKWNRSTLYWDMEAVKDVWEEDAPHTLTPDRRARVQQMRERLNEPTDPQNHQMSRMGTTERMVRDLDLDHGKPVAIIFPSLGHEKHFRLEHFVFDNHVQWLNETLDYLANRDDIILVIRCHPFPIDSKKDPHNHAVSQEIGDAIVARKYGKSLPRNFRLIPATDPTNTTDLMHACDFGIAYNSTCALEMATLGKNAVSCTSIHYQGKGFTEHPIGRNAYFECLEELIADPKRRKLSERQVELALSFMDVYFSKWPYPFPWSIRRGGFLYKHFPQQRLYTLASSISRFTDTFDFLVSQEPVSEEKKRQEIDAYIELARELASRGDKTGASQILGPLESIDLSELAQRYPSAARRIEDFIPTVPMLVGDKTRLFA